MNGLTEIRNMNHNTETYKIVCFFQDDRPREVIDTGLSLGDAQAHCNEKDSKGPGWFDGYEVEA